MMKLEKSKRDCRGKMVPRCQAVVWHDRQCQGKAPAKGQFCHHHTKGQGRWKDSDRDSTYENFKPKTARASVHAA